MQSCVAPSETANTSSFDQFVRERQYLQNVSPRTVEWYREAFKWFRKYPLTEDGLKQFVIGMREHGLKAISCNSYIRVVNAYLRWLGSPLHISKLKEEQKVLPTFSGKQLRLLIGWKPQTHTDHRLYTIVLLLLDTGLRIEEALGLRRTDLLLAVHGKGNKQRIVPITIEGRKALYRFMRTHAFDRVFCVRDGGKLGRREVLRDLKRLCKELGFEPPERTLHALRHTFALNYIRRGGSQFHLMKILGHTSLEMTSKYVSLQIEDLVAVHEHLSPLARAERL